MSDAVLGTSPKGVHKTEETHYLNNMTFDGEDTTGVLDMFSKEQGLWIYSPVAGVDTIYSQIKLHMPNHKVRMIFHDMVG